MAAEVSVLGFTLNEIPDHLDVQICGQMRYSLEALLKNGLVAPEIWKAKPEQYRAITRNIIPHYLHDYAALYVKAASTTNLRDFVFLIHNSEVHLRDLSLVELFDAICHSELILSFKSSFERWVKESDLVKWVGHADLKEFDVERYFCALSTFELLRCGFSLIDDPFSDVGLQKATELWTSVAGVFTPRELCELDTVLYHLANYGLTDKPQATITAATFWSSLSFGLLSFRLAYPAVLSDNEALSESNVWPTRDRMRASLTVRVRMFTLNPVLGEYIGPGGSFPQTKGLFNDIEYDRHRFPAWSDLLTLFGNAWCWLVPWWSLQTPVLFCNFKYWKEAQKCEKVRELLQASAAAAVKHEDWVFDNGRLNACGRVTTLYEDDKSYSPPAQKVIIPQKTLYMQDKMLRKWPIDINIAVNCSGLIRVAVDLCKDQDTIPLPYTGKCVEKFIELVEYYCASHNNHEQNYGFLGEPGLDLKEFILFLKYLDAHDECIKIVAQHIADKILRMSASEQHKILLGTEPDSSVDKDQVQKQNKIAERYVTALGLTDHC